VTTAEIGVFGGSGFYSLLDDVEEVELDTPYGRPSAPLTIGGSAADASRFFHATAATTSCRLRRSTTARMSGR
jgi:purine nucleoside phosphorylase